MENVPSACSYLVSLWHAFRIHRPSLKGWDKVWLLTSNTFLQKQLVKEMLLNTLFLEGRRDRGWGWVRKEKMGMPPVLGVKHCWRASWTGAR